MRAKQKRAILLLSSIFFVLNLLNFTSYTKSSYTNKSNQPSKSQEPDPYEGTVASLKFFHPEIPEPYYDDTKQSAYEKPNPCETGQIDTTRNDGQCGNPIILTKEEQELVPQNIKTFGFNLIASDKVDINREPKDLRYPECKNWHYPEPNKLKKAIVVIVFYNEGFSPVMRTVHTVIKQSPPELLSRVVLVDDGSVRDHLQQPLVDYINSTFPDGKVVLFRNERRMGLITARSTGGMHAQGLPGDVLIYLDSHCEPQPNWLPPLLSIISRDARTVAVPFIDAIDGNRYTFSSQGGGGKNGHARGAWDWQMSWKRIPLGEKEANLHKYKSEPYASPAQAGGLFAIDKTYFKELGYYDPQLFIWGGENFEISYKVWMCGGRQVFVPCSRVGHIYRLEGWDGNPPPDWIPKNPSLKNYMRVVETWWDDYRVFLLTCHKHV